MYLKKVFYFLVLSFGIMFLTAGCNPANNTANGPSKVKSDSDVVASVGSKNITRGDLDKRLEKLYGKKTLDRIVEETVVKIEAENSKVQVSQKDVDEKLAKIKQQFPGEKEFNQAVKDTGMTIPELMEQIKIQVFVEKTAKVNLTDKDVEEYVKKNPAVKSMPKAQIKEWLKQKKLDEWINGLKKKSSIKVTFEPR